MQGKWSEVRNFPSERKQSKNHCSPVKLESKKHDKKIIAKKNRGFGRGDPIDSPGRATSRYETALVQIDLAMLHKYHSDKF